MQFRQFLTASFLAILPIAFNATSSYSFNLINNSINFPLTYTTPKGDNGTVWVDPI